jgi:GH18 family chitinase
MTYDMIDASNGRQDHHAGLTAVQDALKSFVDRGCPSSKLILGIPAYARNGQNPGLVKTYSEIIDDYFTDEQSMMNNFQRKGMVNGYYFDSPALVAKKVKYAKSIGLGGVFVWEIGQDKQVLDYPGGILLQSAASSHVTSVTTSGEL